MMCLQSPSKYRGQLGQHDCLARVAETVEGKRRREEVYDEVSRQRLYSGAVHAATQARRLTGRIGSPCLRSCTHGASITTHVGRVG